MNARWWRWIVGVLVVAGWPACAAAQESFEVGGQFVWVNSSELDQSDPGLGARIAWLMPRLLGIEGEINVFPRDLPAAATVTRGRVEGLFGVTAGPRFGRMRPFARLRPGFVTFREAPQPIACILIFPPPLSCALAAGRTVFALDVGGGFELLTPAATFVRVDLGDRLLKYPGPTFDRSRNRHDDDFFSHDFRVAIGGGWRF